MLAVYQRVSTDKQQTDMQSHAINQWLADKGLKCDREYIDKGYSGKSSNRPAFQDLVRDINESKVKTVVVYRLDRLSRDAIGILKLLMDWIGRGIEFYAVDQPILQLGLDNPFRLTILSIFSELAQVERETIVGRIKTGIEAARARGVQIGRKSTISPELSSRVVHLRKSGKTFREISNMLDVPCATIFRAAKQGTGD